MNLSNLKVGDKAKIVKLNMNKGEDRRHLLDMGLVKDTLVTIKKKAPTGDPITIALRDYELCLSKDILNKIDVEVIYK